MSAGITARESTSTAHLSESGADEHEVGHLPAVGVPPNDCGVPRLRCELDGRPERRLRCRRELRQQRAAAKAFPLPTTDVTPPARLAMTALESPPHCAAPPVTTLPSAFTEAKAVPFPTTDVTPPAKLSIVEGVAGLEDMRVGCTRVSAALR